MNSRLHTLELASGLLVFLRMPSILVVAKSVKLLAIIVYLGGLLFWQAQIATHCYSSACTHGWYGSDNNLYKLGFFVWAIGAPAAYFWLRQKLPAATVEAIRNAKFEHFRNTLSQPPVALENPTKDIAVHTIAPSCPKCGGQMRHRVAHKGRYRGRPFWGCRRYPSCTGIVSIEN